jgi:hypothetical protein
LNSKTAKTLREYCAVSRLKLKEAKKRYYETPTPLRGSVVANMRQVIDLYWETRK